MIRTHSCVIGDIFELWAVEKCHCSSQSITLGLVVVLCRSSLFLAMLSDAPWRKGLTLSVTGRLVLKYLTVGVTDC